MTVLGQGRRHIADALVCESRCTSHSVSNGRAPHHKTPARTHSDKGALAGWVWVGSTLPTRPLKRDTEAVVLQHPAVAGDCAATSATAVPW